MSRRPVRIALILVGFLATAGAGYRAFHDQQALDVARGQSQSIDRTAEGALFSISELRAVLHAYVAPGQDASLWTSRAATLLDTSRQRFVALDAALATSHQSLSDSIDDLDKLAKAEKRAREYVDNGQDLLAGDVIFAEIRDLTSAATKQVASAREGLRTSAGTTTRAIQKEQAALVLAVVATWAAVAMLLVPAHQKRQETGWRQQLADTIKKSEEPELSLQLAQVATDVPVAPAPEASTARLKPETLRATADVCADLSAIVDIGALSGALSRACDVLGATGLVVWVGSNDGSLLSPVASHGFDPNLIMRIGNIRRDSNNVTAAAFREGAARVSEPTATLPSALAVALCGPSGPVGVLSAELRPGFAVDETCLALATIFAAQLATLALPMPASMALETPWPKQAQA